MAKTKFRVLRQHTGDKPYAEGDTREADEGEVAHLIGTTLEKMAEKPANKAAPKSANKKG